jgi:hypothetical protein
MSPQRVTKAQRGSTDRVLLILSLGAVGVNVRRNAQPLYPSEEYQYPLYRKLGGPQGPSKLVRRRQRQNLLPQSLKILTVHPVAS